MRRAAHEGKPRVAYLWMGSIPVRPNGTKFARPRYLAENCTLRLLTRRDASVPEEIGTGATVMRPPFGRLRPSPLDRLAHLVWLVLVLARLQVTNQLDLMYSSWHHWSLGMLLARPLGRARMVLDVWDDPALGIHVARSGGAGRLELALRRATLLLTRIMIRSADRVVCALEPWMLEGYQIRPERLVHVTNGVDRPYVQSLRPAAPPEGAAETVIFYCGVVTEDRGGMLLLDAFRVAAATLSEPRLIVAGDTNPKSERSFRQAIETRGLGNRVTFLGETPSEEVIRRMYEATICVFPFPHRPELEGIYPIKVLEYMAAGAAIVATDLSGVARLTDNGRAAYLVAAKAEPLGEAIVRLVSDVGYRHRLAEAALERSSELDWPVVQAPILDAIHSLVPARATRPQPVG